MLKQFLELGWIVSTHGVRGEVRVQYWCDDAAFACKFKTLYLDARGEKAVRVLAARPHGNVVLMKLDGVETVEQANLLRNKTLFMARKDAKIPEGVDFIADLIGCAVLDADNNEKCYGTLTDVASNGANEIWEITDEAGRKHLMPAVPMMVKRTDAANDKVYISPIRGIFDDAV
ncbi:MAG TPA: 16S rRNA processing protein RimM [Ruminococcaceae bacterium]|nr:16S rRNA processing protein RimM [Oscillospiraceae bacterium]